ncbi:MAG: glycosyltransferase family 4 protein [Chloroflexi bacterium]|nr:glycosyltransferase family 4 protein [Chloroflexota bacterium]
MTKRLRVDMIILEYHPIVGGAQRQLAMVAPLLQARGVDVRILTRRYDDLPPFEVIEGIPVHRLPAPGPKLVAASAFTLAAYGAIRRSPPDVIHAYSLFSPLSTAVWAKRRLDVPVVAKVLRGGLLGDIARMRQKPLGTRRLASYRRQVDGFITISQEIDAELAGIGVPADRRFFIPNGVDLARFRPLEAAAKAAKRRELGLPDGLLALFTGRLAAEKRVDQLVALWPSVRQQFPTAVLLLLGDGPEASALKAQAGAGVLFGGRVDDVASYLQTADLFVLPSATEGLSNSLLEAMATGVACVVTAVGGAPDVVAHGRSGWLIPPDSMADLETAVRHLLGDEAARATLGQQARQKMTAEFGLESVADTLRALYDSLLRPEW